MKLITGRIPIEDRFTVYRDSPPKRGILGILKKQEPDIDWEATLMSHGKYARENGLVSEDEVLRIGGMGYIGTVCYHIEVFKEK